MSRPPAGTLRTALTAAALAVLAMALTAAATALLAPRADLVILGVALALMLSGRDVLGTRRGFLESLVVLPLLSLAVAGVGAVFLAIPGLGAALFTAAVALSVAARRFGGIGRRLGSLAALPFVTLLVAPVRVDAHADPVVTLALVVLVSLVALAVVGVLRLAATRLGLLPRAEAAEPEPAGEATLRPSAPTRMAIQMALAVGAAWAVGLLLLPEHAAWAPLSAYLVLVRNRGRADVVHASVLRLLGAGAGTVIAFLVADRVALDGVALAVVAIAALGIGTLLRAVASSALWTLAVTLVVALLQESTGLGVSALGERLVAILAGVALAVLAASVVLPVRSDGVLRRRLGAVLAAVDARWSGEGEEAPVDRALARLAEVAPPWRDLALLPLPPARQRGEWIRLTREIARAPVPETPPRRELGAARRALREPSTLGVELTRVRALLD